MSEEEYYQGAIDLLMSEDTDFREICIALAKTDPKALCKAAGRTPWQLEAWRVYQRSNKIEAIKYIRAQTGMDLREAKETIESIMQEKGAEQ